MDAYPESASVRLYVELGGSRLRVSARRAGVLSLLSEGPAPKDIETLATILERCWISDGAEPVTVMMACPGLVDLSGRVHRSLHSFLSDVDVAGWLRARTTGVAASILVANDVVAQAAGLDASVGPTLYVAIGTSVGAALCNSGDVYRGAHGFCAELGHVPIPGASDPCPCGLRGCLDLYASGDALEKKLGPQWWVSIGPSAEAQLEDAGSNLGAVLSYATALLDPRSIVVAGNLTTHAAFRRGVKRTVNGRSIWPQPYLQFLKMDWSLTCAGLDRLLDGQTTAA